jgi:hypothetical protein
LLDQHGSGNGIDKKEGKRSPLETDGPEDQLFDDDPDNPSSECGGDQGNEEMGIDIPGNKKSEIGGDGYHSAVRKVGEFKDIEDDAKPDCLEGINAAEGNPIKDLLEQDVPFHRSSFQWKIDRTLRENAEVVHA